jgi:hypothetical protein
MNELKLTAEDWEEIFYALQREAYDIERGKYDDFPGEVERPRSETRRWAVHLRRIMRKIAAHSKGLRG